MTIALAQEWGGGGLEGLGMAAELIFLVPVAPAAWVIVLWYLFSARRAAAICFAVLWWIVAALNVLLLVSGLWQFVMVTSFNYSGTDAFNKVLPPTTVLVLLAKPMKSLLLRGRVVK